MQDCFHASDAGLNFLFHGSVRQAGKIFVPGKDLSVALSQLTNHAQGRGDVEAGREIVGAFGDREGGFLHQGRHAWWESNGGGWMATVYFWVISGLFLLVLFAVFVGSVGA